MPPLLYLDTARLGQMTPAAKDAQLDFVRLSAEEPSSLYFEKFLRDGYAAWPDSYQARYPGLRTWSGVSGLKRSLRQLVAAPDGWQVLLASRSLVLVKLAASCMFRVCRNALATDLSWPTYKQALQAQANRTGSRLTTIAVRDEILHHRWTSQDIASYLAAVFAEHDCDGLFLPAVDHLGIRLPLRAIVEAIRQRCELRFCLVDAAQAICHVPLDDSVATADFIVAGSHKWMGAYLPMGIGLFGQPQSRDGIVDYLRRRHQRRPDQDPLLRFVEQVDSGHLDGSSETANLVPTLACAGAVSDRLAEFATKSVPSFDSELQQLARPPGTWELLRPTAEWRSRIALLRLTSKQRISSRPNDLRKAWLQSGAVVSAYPGRIVRLSFQ